MNHKFLYDLALDLGALPDSVNFIVKRSDLVEKMREQGYAERTIANHAAPSRAGGIINQLLGKGLITDGGLKRWLIPFVQKLNEPIPKRKPPTKLYLGNIPDADGWFCSTRLDDDDEIGLEWRLYRQEFGHKCNNLKVVAIGKRVPHKANYWMNSRNGKVLMTKNAVLLKQHMPDIFNNLCDDIAEIDA